MIGDDPEQRPPDDFLTRAAQADETDDLARVDLAIDRPDLRHHDRLRARAAASRGARAGRRKTCDGSRPTISRIASSGVVFGTSALPRDAAVAQHDHAVGDLEHFVESMRHVDHRDAARAQSAQRGEQPRSPHRPAGSRSVRRAPGSRPRRRAPWRSRPATSRFDSDSGSGCRDRCRRRAFPARARRAGAPRSRSIRPWRRGKPSVRQMFSATVIQSIRPRSWWMKAIGKRRSELVTSAPRKRHGYRCRACRPRPKS